MEEISWQDSSILKGVSEAYLTTLMHNECLSSELAQIITCLKRKGIEVVVIKGGALWAEVYTDKGLRPVSDVDLLIRPKDLGEIERVMSGLGFKPDSSRDLSTFANEFRFVKGKNLLIELRWNMIHYDRFRFLDHLNIDDIFKNSVDSSLDGVEIKIPSPEYQLLIAVFHLSVVHHFERNTWLDDIAAIIEHYSKGLDWAELTRLAKHYHIQTALSYSLTKCRGRTPSSHLNPLRLKLLNWSTRRNFNFVTELLLLDRPQDMAKYIAAILYPSRDWLENHYQTHRLILFYRLTHPFICAAIAFIKGGRFIFRILY